MGQTRRAFIQTAVLGAASLVIQDKMGAAVIDVPPILPPERLTEMMGNSRVVVLDIRSAEQYKKGHIPGAISVPMKLWIVAKSGLSLELPSEAALRELLGGAGIDSTSHIVIVTGTETDFSRSDAARVAWTCAIAGVQSTSVLDGGFNRWIKEIRAVSTENVSPSPITYAGKFNFNPLVSKEYILRKLGKINLVDTRLPDDYFGITSKPGHIKGAVNLPAPWAFTASGSYRAADVLNAMASGVVGPNKSAEVILYCGVGGFAGTWWLLLSRLSGYRNVKVYDGSMDEWSKDPSAPVSAYTWK